MSRLRNLPIDDDATRIRARTPSPMRAPKNKEFRRSHSQGSSPLPGRIQMNPAKSQPISKTRVTGKQPLYMSHSPFLTRAARYSEGNNFMPSPEPERRQKSKNFFKKNSLINRLRSGSWHASSGSEKVKPLLGIRRVSEGSQRSAFEKLLPAKEHETVQEEDEMSGLIHHVLESHLCNVEFDQTKASGLCGRLSKVLEKSVKSRLEGDGKHFKISAVVYMAEVKDDGMKMATQCTWEPSQDHFAMATYETDTLFVTAMVFAVLFNDDLET